MSANPILFFGTKDRILTSAALRVFAFSSAVIFLLGIVVIRSPCLVAGAECASCLGHALVMPIA